MPSDLRNLLLKMTFQNRGVSVSGVCNSEMLFSVWHNMTDLYSCITYLYTNLCQSQTHTHAHTRTHTFIVVRQGERESETENERVGKRERGRGLIGFL